MRRFDHLDLRVVDRQQAREFYDPICALLGFPYEDDGEEWLCYSSVPPPAIGEYLAITEDRAHRPSRICHALWADSKDEVDWIAAGLRAAGVPALEGPGMFYQGHYAVYFEDPSGNRFEVCYREYTHAFDPRIAADTTA
jgi:catechol 2,3-dioxygenase-like lactoylglutathione lyase family enzyme